MVLDLFSSLDFYWSKFSILNLFVWVISLIWIIIFKNTNKNYSRIWVFWQILSILMVKLKLQNIHYKLKGVSVYFSSFFLFLFISKFWGLKVYFFGWTSHILIMLPISLLLWLSFNFSSLLNNIIYYFSHLTPLGSPKMLAPVLNMFELMSNIIRPITLALRLGMNITTGHMFISLLSTMNCSIYFSVFWFLFVGISVMVSGYFLFEVGISFMQGFVFSLLCSQYLEEHTLKMVLIFVLKTD